MPRPVVDANDPRNRALRSHPTDGPPLYHGLDETPQKQEETSQQHEELPASTKWRDINWSSDLLRNHPFRSSLPNSPRWEEDEQPDQVEAASDSLKGEELSKFRRHLFGGSPDQQNRGLFGNVSESPSSAELSQWESPSRDGYWGKRFARRIKDSKGSKSPEDKPGGLGLHGVDFKDASATTEPLQPIVSPQEETEESLNSLIDDLVAEDGKNPDVELLTLVPDKDNAYDPVMIETAVNRGLTDDEVAERRKNYGWNRLTQDKANHLIKFLMFFMGPIQWVMEAAIVLAGGLQDWIDFGIICALLLLNAVVGFGQEYHAGNIVASLKKTLALRALVVRNSKVVEISAEEVVIGDIVHLEDGSIIPADGKLVCDGLIIQVDQSGITGESLAVDKHKGDPCFASSAVKRGFGLMVATAIGDNTFVGTAAALVSKAEQCVGHFTRVLNGMARALLYLVIFTLLAVWVASYYRSDPIVQILEFTLAITVIGVPVGLPVVVTTTMAVGAAYLAKRKAIVQKLSAIESLAGVEILCSDKTGTLTRNILTLGDPYVVPGITTDELMLTACLAANRKKGGIDAIDKVFLKGLRYYPQVKDQITSYKTLEFTPFDPVSKKVTAIVEDANGEQMICIKGAPKTVLNTVQEETSLNEFFVAEYKSKVFEFANRGFRSLGVARKRAGRNWEILGIMPCSDPPRHDTAQTITEAKSLGLSIKMLTGDAVGIARETAAKLGLGTNIYNAERLGVTGAGSMSGSEVADFVEAADGFAEVFPQHKYSVVEILQNRGYLVAMTGDGVNDAASLKKADTGIAVEGASDAARSAADIVFLEPGLSAIIDAIKTSRQIFHRMYSYVVYRIALSIHLEFYFAIKIFVENEILDLRLVVLFAIFADIATLAIAYDNASYSQSPVKWNTPRLWGESIVLGIILALGSWVTYGTMLLDHEGGIIEGRGSRNEVMFLQIALTQSWLILVTRAAGAGSQSLWKNPPSIPLCGAIGAVDVTAALMARFGVFGETTSGLTIVRVWVISFGAICVAAMAFILMHNSPGFDSLTHCRLPRRKTKERSKEDFGLNMTRTANEHEELS